VPPELGGQLDEAVAEATGALITRGIHPAVLAERGLGAVAEALTNAAKHSGASEVSVEVEVEVGVAGEILRVAVRDDGAGGVDLSRGTGLAGLKDRMEALGAGSFSTVGPGPGPGCRPSSRSPPASPRPGLPAMTLDA
jgi:signal transduction histidine kinase